jgi:hypothetical protein
MKTINFYEKIHDPYTGIDTGVYPEWYVRILLDPSSNPLLRPLNIKILIWETVARRIDEENYNI